MILTRLKQIDLIENKNLFGVISLLFLLASHYPRYLLSASELGSALFLTGFEVITGLLIVGFIYIISIAARRKERLIVREHYKVLFLLCISMVLIDIFQSLGEENVIDRLRFIPHSKIIRTTVVFSLLVVFLDVSDSLLKLKSALLKVFLYFITLQSLLHIFLWGFMPLEVFQLDNFVTFRDDNHLSYQALSVVFLILFVPKEIRLCQLKNITLAFLLTINLLVIVLNTTRGAILIVGALLVLKVAHLLKYKKKLFLFFSLSLILGGTVVIVTKKHKVKEVTQALNIITRVYRECPDIIELQACLDTKHNMPRKVADGIYSSYVRIGTNFLGGIKFASSPVMGIGSWGGYAIKVLGNGIHSFSFLFLTSYGILGALLLLLFVAGTFKVKERKFEIFALWLFIWGVMMFSNKFLWWFACILFFCDMRKSSREELRCAKENE